MSKFDHNPIPKLSPVNRVLDLLLQASPVAVDTCFSPQNLAEMQSVLVRYARNLDIVDVAQHSKPLQNPMFSTSPKSGIPRICKVDCQMALIGHGNQYIGTEEFARRPGQCVSSLTCFYVGTKNRKI